MYPGFYGVAVTGTLSKSDITSPCCFSLSDIYQASMNRLFSCVCVLNSGPMMYHRKVRREGNLKRQITNGVDEFKDKRSVEEPTSGCY